MNRYPIYVISKDRATCCLTARFLKRDGVPFSLVIEPQQREAYAGVAENILTLPFSNLGLGSIPARNWCWEHAKAAGFERHWILDDNIYNIVRRYKGKRINCNSEIAFRTIEDFTDRFDNLAIAGLNYSMFAPDMHKMPPFVRNVHVYSCLLIRNDLSYRWRGRYNEDTDLCLQVLSGGWCTILANAFLIRKVATLKMGGGNMTELYQGDGRLKMARSLERMWPGVVSVKRRFRRPQHIIKSAWANFDTPLKLKPSLPPVDPTAYAMNLVQVKPIQSPTLQDWYRKEIAQ